MKTLILGMLFTVLAAHPAMAQAPSTDEADVAAKGAQVEALRARSAHVPSANLATGLIEAENLLRQLRAAPAGKREALSAQLDAALVRLELELNQASRGR